MEPRTENNYYFISFLCYHFLSLKNIVQDLDILKVIEIIDFECIPLKNDNAST